MSQNQIITSLQFQLDAEKKTILEYNILIDEQQNEITKLKNNNDNNNQIEIQDLSNIQNMDNNEIIKLIHNLTKNNPNQTQPGFERCCFLFCTMRRQLQQLLKVWCNIS